MKEFEITMTILVMAEGDKSMSKYESKYVDCVATCACGATFEKTFTKFKNNYIISYGKRLLERTLYVKRF